MLEGKLIEARSKKDTLKARAASARTSKQIQEMVDSLNTSNAVVAFEKMEEKVVRMEAEAESTAMLVAGDRIEDKFVALEATTIEDELAVLKRDFLASSKPSLPLGRPLKDAIDLELDLLRNKIVRE
jgi:phage shock protein A